jgi:hypothetical protein
VKADDERELAALVRRALQEEADRQVPAGDGLARIRERLDQRRRRLSWLRPVLVVATAAGVATAAIALPTMLRRLDRGGAPVITGAAVPGPSGPPKVSTLATRPDRPTLPPEAGVVDMRTVWPYESRAQGYYSANTDVATGKHPELTDAGQAAVTFVQRYVGPRVVLTAGSAAAKDRGVGVVVNRTLADGSSHPVTRVYLVQVSRADRAPYVVASAERPALAEDRNTLTVVPPADPVRAGDDHITVSGTIQPFRPAEVPPVQVEVGDAGGSALSFNRATPEPSATEPDTYIWTASVSLEPGEADRAVTLVAWTLDSDAGVLEFVATPVPLPRDIGQQAPTPTATATR